MQRNRPAKPPRTRRCMASRFSPCTRASPLPQSPYDRFGSRLKTAVLPPGAAALDWVDREELGCAAGVIARDSGWCAERARSSENERSLIRLAVPFSIVHVHSAVERHAPPMPRVRKNPPLLHRETPQRSWSLRACGPFSLRERPRRESPFTAACCCPVVGSSAGHLLLHAEKRSGRRHLERGPSRRRTVRAGSQRLGRPTNAQVACTRRRRRSLLPSGRTAGPDELPANDDLEAAAADAC